MIAQDVDLVYFKNPIPYLDTLVGDVLLSSAFNPGPKGPGNTGFLLVRSNPSTKIFMASLVNLVIFSLTTGSDQIFYNQVLAVPSFRQLKVLLITHEHVMPMNLLVDRKKVNRAYPDEMLAAHAISAGKVEKLIDSGVFYFVPECSYFTAKVPVFYDDVHKSNHPEKAAAAISRLKTRTDVITLPPTLPAQVPS